MKFFIDTANLDEIKEAVDMGLLDGVTTNPSLVARENREFKELIKEICEIVDGPVSAEVISTDFDGMMKEAEELLKIADNIAIKLPMINDGVKACKALSSKGIKVNMTLVFNPMQAIFAAKAGAAFVSPFIGRLDDISTNGMELIRQIVTIYDNYLFDTEVLVASVRHPMHVVEAAELGADVCTIPFAVINKLIKHPLTDIGLQNFLKDWGKMNSK